ncbi:NAD(P)H-dependent oxidoreductase [Dictyobacter formicarum]|uniref:FMN reductase n=1 Tax=Dictyobacter formicarum TaxID=2778368 RepID=A0ABQ3VG17_9CHLR|nr:NAD(P)H-dependent oxidoreductase [Dictyobacter formicarum]GHO84061.1 FMN reductase [Dictyobacter formicarum]
MSFKLLAINGSLTPPPSRTRIVLDKVLAGAKAYDPTIEAQVLELRDFALEFCDGRSPDSYNSDTRRALALVEEADAYLVATPIYRGSYTGALKNFFDLVPNDPHGRDPLRGKVVGLLATGGSDHHYLVLEHQLRPLFGFFGSYIPARAIYASAKDFDALKQAQGRLVEELTLLGQEVVTLSRFLRESPHLSRPERVGSRHS